MELTVQQKQAMALAAARKRQADGGAMPAAAPDAALQPGTREYADWAAEQARAGNTLPQVSDAPPEPTRPDLTGPEGKFVAGFTSAVNDIPIAGPTLLRGVEGLRAAAQGMDPEAVAAEGAEFRDANPITSKTAGIGSAIASFLPLGMTGLGARALGMTGSIPARMLAGTVSGGTIAAADTAARGGSGNDALQFALLGGGIGMAAPLVGAAGSEIWKAMTRTGASSEASILARALRDDEIPVDDLARQLADKGDGAMVMDLGPNLQSQAGALASLPGNAQKTVRSAVAARGADASQRVADDVAQTIGTGPEITALRDQIVTAQSDAAGPLYDAIRDLPIQTPSVIKSILQRPQGQQAMQDAIAMAANDGYHFPASGDVMTVGLADYLKRSLDDIASKAGRTGGNNEARTAANMARAITAAVDPLAPGYKAARDAFAGPAQVLDAIDNGASVFTKEMSPPQLKTMLAGMSASESDGFLAGAQSSIEAMMGNAVNDPLALRNMFKKGWNEAKLRILVGDDVADDLLKRMDREASFGTTTNVVSRNSETARRQAAQGEVDPKMSPVSQMSMIGAVLAAINKARAGVRGVVQPKVNARLAAALKSGAGDIDPATIEQLRRASLPRPKAMVAPAVPAIEGTRREPIQIEVRGGRR